MEGKVEEPSISKYVSLHRRHISQRGNNDIIICENANIKFVESIMKHSKARSLPICHHCRITSHIRLHCHHCDTAKVGFECK
jgi:primosomal protein N'